MKKKIFHNWGLKLGSLVLAFVLWLLVIQIGDPKETEVFRNIQVKLINTELLDQQNKVYEVLDNTDKVSVTVRAPQSVINSLTSSDIVAEADMSKLTEINTIVISFNVLNADVDSVRGNPDAIRLNVEERRSKWINVRYNITGEVAEGYVLTSVRPELTRIQITGPKSQVDQVSYAGVELDVSGAVTDITANVETMLCDAEGNVLDLANVVKTSDYVKMDAEVLAAKDVPVEFDISGEPADGYLVTGTVDVDPGTIKAAGRTYTLNNLSAISIPGEDLDITGASENVIKTINIKKYLPSGVTLADSSFDGNVTVTIHVEPEVEKVLNVPVSAVSLINIPEGFYAEFAETEEYLELRVSGLEEVVSALQADTIRGTIDLAAWMEEENMEKISARTHYIPVTFMLPDGVTVKEKIILPVIITKLEGV